MRKSVKYNEVDTYRYLTILGNIGVYIETPIDERTLPDGFFHYELKQSRDRTLKFAAIGKKVRSGYCGDFITREELNLSENALYPLTISDCSFSDEIFLFEPFFGHKLSIDKQIRNAETKRDILQDRHSRGNSDENDNI